MRLRPTVPAAAAAAALLLASGAPALAQGAPATATGASVSRLALLSAVVGESELVAGGIDLVTRTADGTPLAEVVVTPLTLDGAPQGRQTVPAGGSRSVGGASSSALAPALAGLLEVTSPTVEAGAEVVGGLASTSAGTASLGSVRLLGLPVALDGELVAGTATGDQLSEAGKVLELRDVALPSVADLLGALGLDLSKLPVEVLRELVTELDLVDGAVRSAGAALDTATAALNAQLAAAQAEVDRLSGVLTAAQDQVVTRTGALPPLEADLAAKQQAVAVAQAALAAAAPTVALPAAPTTGTLVDGLTGPAQTAVQTIADSGTGAAREAAAALLAANSAAEASRAALEAAKAVLATAQTAVTEAQRLLAAARATLDGLLGQVQPQVQSLRAALTTVLDGTPLVRLDGLTLGSEALVTSAAEGGQSATVTGGEVKGLEVLGTDVLEDVLGSSTLTLTDVGDDVLGRVTDAVDDLTGTLSEVLSTVPALPALKVPAPQIDLLVREATTGIADGFGTATTDVTGLRITLPAISLPAEIALPSALELPGLSLLPPAALPSALRSAAVGDVLTSTPTTLGLGTFSEDVTFRPGALTAAPGGGTQAPGTTDPGTTDAGTDPTDPVASPTSLPRTGASDALALFGLTLVGTAVWLRRRQLVTG